MKSSLATLSILGAIMFTLPACEGSQASESQDEESTQPSGQANEPEPEPEPEPETSTSGTPSTTKTNQATNNQTGSQTSATTGPHTSTPTSSTPTNTQKTGTSSGSTGDTGSTAPAPTVPAPYADQKNPLPQDDTAVIVAGGLRYKKTCGCHVPESKDHQPTAPDLGRSPYSDRADDWLLWKISEGVPGKMEPFKDTFDETERWQIITYLRALASKNAKG